jgi:hypothetical protein
VAGIPFNKLRFYTIRGGKLTRLRQSRGADIHPHNPSRRGNLRHGARYRAGAAPHVQGPHIPS